MKSVKSIENRVERIEQTTPPPRQSRSATYAVRLFVNAEERRRVIDLMTQLGIRQAAEVRTPGLDPAAVAELCVIFDSAADRARAAGNEAAAAQFAY